MGYGEMIAKPSESNCDKLSQRAISKCHLDNGCIKIHDISIITPSFTIKI